MDRQQIPAKLTTFIDRNTVNIIYEDATEECSYTAKRIPDKIHSLNGIYSGIKSINIMTDKEYLPRITLIEFMSEKYMRMLDRDFSIVAEYEIAGSNLIIKISNQIILLDIIGDSIIRGAIFPNEETSYFMKQ